MIKVNKKREKQEEHILNPHEKVVRAFLSDNENAQSFFEGILPEKIKNKLDFSTLRICKDSFVDEKLSNYFSDILYEINLEGKKAFIYILVEHKSTQEIFIALQLLKYMLSIWELHLKQHSKVKKLPMIVPLVVYHGESKWNQGKEFKSIFEAPEEMERFIPDFNYNVYDISQEEDGDIIGNVHMKLLFTTLKYIRSPELRHKLPGILRFTDSLKDKRKGTEYIGLLLRYVASGAKHLSKEDLDEVVTKALAQGGEVMATIAEQWIEEGREENSWEVVKNCLKEGLSAKTIMRVTGMPLDKINSMKEKMA
ncbi:MAG: Rpn family recombination-promoting nuclease/putative transposase [bacterium]|nr:Rpn family recombination-promoting nuclease/putative transposase [bacterium]